ncbi:adenine-specific DNA-methyltransferase [Negativicoccus succinicivorans]|uniref:Adenine-specific DNA-methyltransferase n=1 Tax=Negativicoccus succinicivorans TaxID=620903 RepID=A0A841R0X8_9FIRM|nr:DNA methyltransferase [Negativicoccus succinicivorans]MBB6477565.1 adenine-specific DNA-methyltransferase [Negativicoccus succinicivorans]
MAAINDLINQIEDPELRDRIKTEVEKLSKQKKFGLVFEDHVPECTALYDVPIHVGSRVAIKDKQINTTYIVKSIAAEKANCLDTKTQAMIKLPVDELVSIAEFGEAIYPYLKPIDHIQNAPDSDLWHTIIEADNYHALQLLEYLYAGQVDCIYIDPPYNTGAKDWKYNNDYVDSSDAYRHSKWLSMMEKRLKLAKKLLNPQDSVLICTIDEKEYLHLGCLLEELFPEARMQMVSSVINPTGVARSGDFYRTDEYIYILRFGRCIPAKLPLNEEWLTAKTTGKDSVRWRPIRRQGSHDTRAEAKNQFYPIFISADGTHIIGAGETLDFTQNIRAACIPPNCIAVWPMKTDGTEGCWQISQDSLRELLNQGFIRVTYSKKWGYVPQYLAKGEREKVKKGLFPILGKDEYGTILLGDASESGAPFVPGTQWRISSHSAREQGASLLNKIFPDKRFDFPKSLYAVHDAIRFFVAHKPDALILDFFAGSGTTLHAVNLLNAEDGGHRRCIMVTNNEVSNEESKKLKKAGFKPGDPQWEELGIAHHVTWPRTVCSTRGTDVNGNALKGNYLDSDLPMSDGFKSNAAFFKLGFLDKNAVALGKQLKELVPILWMKTECIGPCPMLQSEEIPAMLLFPENGFAVLVDEYAFSDFKDKANADENIKKVFIVTDSVSGYRDMASHLKAETSYQLYRDYLDNFRINTGR